MKILNLFFRNLEGTVDALFIYSDQVYWQNLLFLLLEIVLAS